MVHSCALYKIYQLIDKGEVGEAGSQGQNRRKRSFGSKWGPNQRKWKGARDRAVRHGMQGEGLKMGLKAYKCKAIGLMLKFLGEKTHREESMSQEVRHG